MLVSDMLHRAFEIDSTPKRIVSLVPSQTELLVDLGLEDNLVGVTKFCVHPAHIRNTATVVGGTKQVHYDRIKQLNADIVICNKEENTELMVQEIEKMAPVWVSDIYTLQDSLKMIRDLGTLLNASEAAQEVAIGIEKEWSSFKNFMKETPKKKVAYFIWKDPYMAVGGQTFINAMLELNNYENSFKNVSRYPEVDIKHMPEVDVVLLSSEPYPFKYMHVDELQNLLQTEVRLVNGEYFSWYGSRLLKSFAYFKTLH